MNKLDASRTNARMIQWLFQRPFCSTDTTYIPWKITQNHSLPEQKSGKYNELIYILRMTTSFCAIIWKMPNHYTSTRNKRNPDCFSLAHIETK